jgi:hypothetical protein
LAQRPFAWIAALNAVLIVHLAGYLLQPDKRISGTLLALAAFVVGFALITTAAALILTSVRLERLRARLGRYMGAWIAVAAAFAFAFGLLIRPEWLYAHIALTFALVMAGFTRALDPERWNQPLVITRPLMIAAISAVIAVIAARIYGLSYAPDLQITDEGWHLGWVMGILREGRFTDYLMYFGGHDVQRYYLPMAAWISVVGAGLWEARLFSYGVTLLVVYVGGRAAGALYGRGAGIIAGLVLFASANVMIGARIRHDAGLALAIGLSLWCYGVALQREGGTGRAIGWHVAAGLLIGLGWFAHYHAVIFGAALLIGLYLPRIFVRQGRRKGIRSLFAFGLGGAFGGGVVYLLQVVPHIAQGDSLARAARGAGEIGGVLASTWGHVLSIAQHSQLEFIVIAAALIAALWRRRVVDGSLALTVILAHIGLGLTQATAWSHYPMPLTPLYAALIAALLTPRAAVQKHLRLSAFTYAVLLTLPILALTLQTPLERAAARAPVRIPPPPAAQWILDNIEPNTLIEGEHFYYLWLTDYRYVSPLTPNFMPDIQRTALPTGESVWDTIDPEIYLFDPNLNTCCILNWMIEGGYFESRGYEIAAQFDGSRYPITIYRWVDQTRDVTPPIVPD